VTFSTEKKRVLLEILNGVERHWGRGLEEKKHGKRELGTSVNWVNSASRERCFGEKRVELEARDCFS